MKYVIAILLLVFLIGCTAEVTQQPATTEPKTTQKTTQTTEQKQMHPLTVEVLGKASKVGTNYQYKKKVINESEDDDILLDLMRKGDKQYQRYASKRHYFDTSKREAYYYNGSSMEYHEVIYYQVIQPDTLLDELKDITYAELLEDSYYVRDKECILIEFIDKHGDKIKAAVWKYYGLPVWVEKNGGEIIIEYNELSVNAVSDEDVTLPPNAEIVPLHEPIKS